ncbi:MAG: XRE family transcriptional regulator [Microbacterium sp.]|nr:XRE family transcriptional regulator [Microbacterium sp.]MBA4345615.1 XRE family transcriptional regulator [Microbacterium sp.]
MTRSFSELSARARETWTDEARQVFAAASTVFQHELDDRAALGMQVRTARRSLALTQPALAELTGLQQSEISRIENGLSNPTLETVLRLARALSMTLTLSPQAPVGVGAESARESARRTSDLRDVDVMNAAWN